MNCTETDAQLAVQYLRNNHWDLEVALEEYWKAVYPESSDDELSSLASGNGGSWESSVEGESEVERQFPAPASVNVSSVLITSVEELNRS